METGDFKLVNVVDAQLDDITSEITLPIHSGPAENTFQQFTSNSRGTNQLLFNVQVPSLSTAFSRKLLIQSEITIEVEFGDNIIAGEVYFNYGESDSLQAFPLNSLITTSQGNLNNCAVTVNANQIMAALLRMYKPDELEKYNSLSPSLTDSFYLNYPDAIGTNNNPMGSYSVGSYNNKYIPRGAFPIVITDVATGAVINQTKLTAQAPAAGSPAGTPPTYYKKIQITFKTTEPLLFLSPFLSGNSNNAASFLGINNMTITLNIGQPNKVFSSGTYVENAAGNKVPAIKNISVVKFTDPKLLLNFFTLPAQAFDKIQPKNICNYLQYAPFIFQSNAALAPDESTTISFNNVQLNQIPQKMVIVARKPLGEQRWTDTNSFCVIENISMNFNNKSGILSSATQSQLYNMSVKNGSQQNFYEFSGRGVSIGNNAGSIVPTSGSILVIDPALDLGLGPQYSNGSGGQYNVQFNLKIKNQWLPGDTDPAHAFTPEIVLICVNSGIFITKNGSSETQSGLYTQEMVLETKSKPSVMDSLSYNKLLGGAIENINSIGKHVKHLVSGSKNVIEDKIEDKIDDVDGGAFSGGSAKKGKLHRFAR